MSEEAGSVSPPGREERQASQEIVVDPGENSRKRAQAFSEVAAALAGNHPRVRLFRRLHLGGRLCSDDNEAIVFLDNIRESHTRRHIWRKLRRLADTLAETYRWREVNAVWFVLTGSVPQVKPLQMLVSVKRSVKDYEPDTALITLTAEPWVDAKAVERSFREAQRQVLGGDARPLPDRTLEAVTFVARRMREHGKEPWSKRLEAWKETYPKEWHYGDYRGFRQVFERFIHRRYGWPKYKESDTD